MYRQHLAPNYIEKAIGTAGTAALCNTAPGFGSWTRVTTGEVTMNLIIQDSVLSTRIGKVTMSFSVGGVACRPTMLASLREISVVFIAVCSFEFTSFDYKLDA